MENSTEIINPFAKVIPAENARSRLCSFLQTGTQKSHKIG